jgi:hypothetical protein
MKEEYEIGRGSKYSSTDGRRVKVVASTKIALAVA